MIVDDCIFPLHERHDDKSLCHFDATKAMSTLHQLACRVDIKNIPFWYEQKQPTNEQAKSLQTQVNVSQGIVGRRGFGGQS